MSAIPGLKNTSHQSKRLTEKWGQKNNTTCAFTFSVPIFLTAMFAEQLIRIKPRIVVSVLINVVSASEKKARCLSILQEKDVLQDVSLWTPSWARPFESNGLCQPRPQPTNSWLYISFP